MDVAFYRGQCIVPSVKDVLKKVMHALLYRNRSKTAVVGVVVLGAGCYMLRNKAIGCKLETLNSRASVSDMVAIRKEGQQHLKIDKVFFERMKLLLSVIVPGPTSLEFVCIICLTVVLMVRTRLSIRVVEIMGLNANALVRVDFKAFVKGVLGLGLVAIPASIVNSLLKFFTNYLALRFRKRLTDYAHTKYLEEEAFRRMSLNRAIDDIDQRITQDIDQLSKVVSELYPSTFKPLVDVVLFTHKLVTSVGGMGVAMLYIYYIVSGFVLRRWIPDFAWMTSEQQKLESDFRHYHVRLLMHAEEIAFYRGWDRERALIDDTFDRYYRHGTRFLMNQAVVDIFDAWLVKYGATMVGYMVVALPVFGHDAMSKRSGEDDVSTFTESYVRNTQILINLAQAIGQIVLLYKRITHMASHAYRVFELFEQLSDIKAISSPFFSGHRLLGSGDCVEFQHVDIATPNRELLLISDLNFRISPGDHTLIMGPNGCGKSSVFRVLNGFWPISSGSIYCPAENDIFFIPQRPYFPAATLRDQIIYPDNASDAARRGVDDDQLLSILADADLAYLVGREGGWDTQRNWVETFSGGEKQKINICRAFYHRPKFLCLDECTSAVSADVEGKLYKKFLELGCTLITISHRAQLQHYHRHRLELTDTPSHARST